MRKVKNDKTLPTRFQKEKNLISLKQKAIAKVLIASFFRWFKLFTSFPQKTIFRLKKSRPRQIGKRVQKHITFNNAFWLYNYDMLHVSSILLKYLMRKGDPSNPFLIKRPSVGYETISGCWKPFKVIQKSKKTLFVVPVRKRLDKKAKVIES